MTALDTHEYNIIDYILCDQGSFVFRGITNRRAECSFISDDKKFTLWPIFSNLDEDGVPDIVIENLSLVVYEDDDGKQAFNANTVSQDIITFNGYICIGECMVFKPIAILQGDEVVPFDSHAFALGDCVTF